MTDLTVIVPSRGRPASAERLITAFDQTVAADSVLLICVDDDDPTLPAYLALPRSDRVGVTVGPRQRLVGWTNEIACDPAVDSYAFGSIGDDHLPQTPGWDSLILTALRALGTGVAFGDDGHQHGNLPTAAFLTADIPAKLGYLAPPELVHLYCDNFWLALGQRVGITYLPDVNIEHLHPHAGKSSMDATYAEANAPAAWMADADAFARYMAERFESDMAKLT